MAAAIVFNARKIHETNHRGVLFFTQSEHGNLADMVACKNVKFVGPYPEHSGSVGGNSTFGQDI